MQQTYHQVCYNVYTTLHSYRLSPFLISNALQLASFDDEYCTLGEESKSCTSEVSNPVDCSDTSTSQLTTSSVPITVLLEDTVYRLFSENTVVFEDCQQTVSHHTEVHTLSCMHKCPACVFKCLLLHNMHVPYCTYVGY